MREVGGMGGRRSGGGMMNVIVGGREEEEWEIWKDENWNEKREREEAEAKKKENGRRRERIIIGKRSWRREEWVDKTRVISRQPAAYPTIIHISRICSVHIHKQEKLKLRKSFTTQAQE
jgi:hypothetical protein